MTLTVEILSASRAETLRGELADILVDCVRGGASISFMLPFGRSEAETWWGGVIASVASL